MAQPNPRRPWWPPYGLILGTPVLAAAIAAGLAIANIPLINVPIAAIHAVAWTTATLAACGSAAGATLIPASRWQRAALTVGFAFFAVGWYAATLVGVMTARVILVEPF